MTTTLYGACGNEGCLDCTPAFVVEFDGGSESYFVEVSLTIIEGEE